MPEDTTPDQARIAHRRGHSVPLHQRAREDLSRADVLVALNDAVLQIGELFDGEMLVVDGDQIVSEPVPGGGGGGTIDVAPGLSGDGSALDPVTIVRGTGANQTRHGNDAAYTDARTPLAHTHPESDITGLVSDLAGKAALAHTHAAADVVSGTLDAARVTAASAGQSLRVNSAGNAIEGFQPGASFINTILEAPVALTAVPANVFTIAIPAAGTYLLDANFIIQAGTLAANRVVTFYFGHASATGCKIGWSQGFFTTNAASYGYGTSFATALPAISFGATNDNNYATSRAWGEFTVSASGNLTVVAEIPGDTATALAGCQIRLIRAA